MNNRWIIDLSGEWELLLEDGSRMPGKLPGCSYLALLENKKIEDPFWGTNEKEASILAEQRFIYRRNFFISKEQLSYKEIELVLDGVDTLAVISVNGTEVGRTDNAFRTYRLPAGNLLWEGRNEIRIEFEPPHELVRRLQKERPLAGMGIGIPGISYIRKPQYHFGWDWGPALPPAGITGKVALEGVDLARLDAVTFSQKHEEGNVYLTINAKCQAAQEKSENLILEWEIVSPGGEVWHQKGCFFEGKATDTIFLEKPMLWWCNGMGTQPLYKVFVSLRRESGEVIDQWERQIGLRKIELNIDQDCWGDNFQFRINGVSLFIKGANWIPADSFVNRVSDEKLEFYIRSAKEANMNMLRVWGGGYYECDRFYELCDVYGILVWQDFAFACRAYPLDETPFLENVKAEVRNQVLRLQHHASLALWCGNNELQLEELLWAKDRALRKAIHEFFFRKLPKWVHELDQETPYWYGSPSDKKAGRRANRMDCGDTHLWQVWHGLMPVEAFCRFPTRFCSEFGLESLPSKNAIAAFTNVETTDLHSAEMLQHQKSSRGNEKLLYYVTKNITIRQI